jgi:acylpyruvate hydrolase
MRLGTYRSERGPRVIRVVDEGFLDVGSALQSDAPWTGDLRLLLEAGPDLLARVAAARAASGAEVYAPDLKRLGPPIARPGKILCIGLNYRAHALEGGHGLPAAPEVFYRTAATLSGPRDPVPMPSLSERFDLESELCVVIGGRGRHVTPEHALDIVAGYTILNDMSVRDFQQRGSQWGPGKNWDGSAPCGPFLVTADEVPDAAALDIGSDIDGFGMQGSNTADLIFDVPTLIADLTQFTTLEPGDLIATGTPSGVGDARRPPRYLHVGETARCTVARLGSLENRVVAEGEWQRWRDGLGARQTG